MPSRQDAAAHQMPAHRKPQCRGTAAKPDAKCECAALSAYARTRKKQRKRMARCHATTSTLFANITPSSSMLPIFHCPPPRHCSPAGYQRHRFSCCFDERYTRRDMPPLPGRWHRKNGKNAQKGGSRKRKRGGQRKKRMVRSAADSAGGARTAQKKKMLTRRGPVARRPPRLRCRDAAFDAHIMSPPKIPLIILLLFHAAAATNTR